MDTIEQQTQDVPTRAYSELSERLSDLVMGNAGMDITYPTSTVRIQRNFATGNYALSIRGFGKLPTVAAAGTIADAINLRFSKKLTHWTGHEGLENLTPADAEKVLDVVDGWLINKTEVTAWHAHTGASGIGVSRKSHPSVPEQMALEKVFPFIGHDTAFLNVLLPKLREDRAALADDPNNKTAYMTVARNLRETITADPDLKDFFPAYERMVNAITAHDRKGRIGALLTNQPYRVSPDHWKEWVADIRKEGGVEDPKPKQKTPRVPLSNVPGGAIENAGGSWAQFYDRLRDNAKTQR